MASTIKVDKIEGSTGSTVTVPTGQTFTVTDGIPVASGGTGLTSLTQGDILYATGATTLVKLAKGTGRQGLQTNSGATAPEWTDSPQSLMTAAGDVLYASGANTLAKLAKGSDDDVLTLASGVPSWAAAAGGGLTQADTWRLTTTFVGTATPIASNWEQTDTSGQSVLGSSMTESSGIFTFPSTGYYMVGFGSKQYQSSGPALYNELDIDITINNSAYVKLVEAWGSHYAYASWDGVSCHAIVDVTDVANVKVRFSAAVQSTPAGQTTYGDSDINVTYATFMRLADT